VGSSTLEQFVYHPVREARPPLLSRREFFLGGLTIHALKSVAI